MRTNLNNPRYYSKHSISFAYVFCMGSLLKPGQLLKGKACTYTITKQLHESTWLAMCGGLSFLDVMSFVPGSSVDSGQNEQTAVIKSALLFRIHNERSVLERFQSRTASLRPLIHEIEDPSDPPAIVLTHLDDDLLEASDTKRLTLREIKYIAKRFSKR